MASTYYIDSDSTLSGISTVDGDTLLFKTNTTFSAGLISATFLKKNNLTIAEYGTGERPIISGAVTHTGAEFTQDSPNGVWYINFAHTNYGNIIEDGTAMSFIAWTTNIATTSALMSVGDYAIDQVNQRIYIKTSDNNPVGKTYITSEVYRAFVNTDTVVSGLTIKNLDVRNISDGAFTIINTSNTIADNISMDMCGGHWHIGGFFAGNGFSFGPNCYNGVVSNCTANRIFDSGFSAQIFTDNTSISDILFENNTVTDSGLSAVEISLPNSTTNMKLKNVGVDGLTATDIGVNSWGRKNSGIGIIFTVTAPIESSKTMKNCTFKNITVTNALGLIRTGYNYGINKFQDIYGTNITTLLTDYGLASTGEKRLYYNVRDNLGNTPSGTAGWQLTPGLALPTRTILSR